MKEDEAAILISISPADLSKKRKINPTNHSRNITRITMPDKIQIDDTDTCGRCEEKFVGNVKIVACSTCKLIFHIDCAHVSQEKFEILCEEEDLFWFCRACKCTTANMINNLAHLELRLKAIETEREREKEDFAIMKKQVGGLQVKVKKLEESIRNSEETCKGELESIKFMVNEMLSELPNTNSVLKRFNDIEDHLEQCQSDLLQSKSMDLSQSYVDAQSENACLSEYNISAVSNELSERKKREKSFVIHNLPETTDEGEDTARVKDIIEEIIETKVNNPLDYDDLTNKPRVYRLGRKMNGKTRTIKIHVRSVKVCESILSCAKKLSNSDKYSTVVVQRDLTSLEQKQLKRLVNEKKRRNSHALLIGEEPNWTIRDGILYRRS